MNINQFKIQLNEFLESSGISGNKLATLAEVPQSQISDWNKGKGVRFTANARKVLHVIDNYRKSPNGTIPTDIEEAVKDLLNGDQTRAKALEKILRSLKEALPD